MNLAVLNLENNQIKTIEEDAFDDMPHLYALDLSSNKLSVLNPNWLENSPTITVVSLSDNLLELVQEGAFKYMNRERSSIYLNGNRIKVLEERCFENLKDHSRIWLERNQIQSVPFNILPKSNHTFELSLRGNSFVCISDEIVHHVAQSCAVLDFRENPFSEICHDDVRAYSLENKRKLKIYVDDKKELRKLY